MPWRPGRESAAGSGRGQADRRCLLECCVGGGAAGLAGGVELVEFE